MFIIRASGCPTTQDIGLPYPQMIDYCNLNFRLKALERGVIKCYSTISDIDLDSLVQEIKLADPDCG